MAKKPIQKGIEIVSREDHPDVDFDAMEKDAELWERRELGATEEFVGHITRKEAEKIDNALDDALGLSSITIRFQADLIKDFKRFAREDGIGYQPLMRLVLTKYAAERKRKQKH